MVWINKIINISDGGYAKTKIENLTGDNDYILALKYQLYGWVCLNNDPKAQLPATPNAVYIAYDPPGDLERPGPGFSHHTTFDGVRFKERAADYQNLVIEYFADLVLSARLQNRTYIIEPTVEVRAALGGRLPATIDDIADALKADPSLIRHVTYTQGSWNSHTDLSDGAREAIRTILDTQDNLNSYLESPEAFVRSYDVTDAERDALVNAATQTPELVIEAFDHAELGRSTIGDGDTYILIGFDRENNRPSAEGLEWFSTQIDAFVELNGYTPNFGWYISAAALNYQVIAGPGVTAREIEFLSAEGSEVVDKTDGSAIDEPLPYTKRTTD